jgi:cellulose synthase/poly-beta-1,6-N-acetylglucosamine synthase-like glycosyltransferase
VAADGWALDWLTLSLAVSWVVAGVILVVVGWLTLPRRPASSMAEAEDQRASPSLRAIGGALLGAVATVVAAWTLVRGHGWASDALVPAWSIVRILTGKFLSAPYGRWFADLGVILVRAVRLSVLDLETAFRSGWFALALHARLLWGDRAYALVNATALAVTALVGGFAGWISSSSRWRASGVLTYLGLDLVALGLIGFSLVIVESSNGPVAEGLGLWLAGVELFGLVLFLAYQFYTLEYIAGRPDAKSAHANSVDPSWAPFVLVQVACFNEPPEVVRESLEAIRRLDYPAQRYQVQLVDDSTDPAIVAQLADICAMTGVQFQHRSHRRGFKGGALNDGLAAVFPPPDIVAIVDADYVVDPDFLKVGVQPFRETDVGFVQTPQAYRNASSGTFARWYALADVYFYQVVQPIRARVQSLIFCGTMGLVRRTALRSAGGWSEECVTEDAELSLRMLANGWRGEYLRQPLGRGLAPEEMRAVRSQHRRWAFGGLQMLRMNRGYLSGPGLTARQKRDFRMSGWFWMDGLFVAALASALTAIVVATWFGILLPFESTAALAIVASAPLLLMLDGVLKLRIALRSNTPVTARDVLGIMGFWYAIKMNDLRAAVRGWSGAKMAFVRTPKEAQETRGVAAALKSSIRDSSLETVAALGLLAVAAVTAARWGVLSGAPVMLPEWFLLIWLVYYAGVFLCAPAFDYFSQRSGRAEQRRQSPAPTGGTEGRFGSKPTPGQ